MQPHNNVFTTIAPIFGFQVQFALVIFVHLLDLTNQIRQPIHLQMNLLKLYMVLEMQLEYMQQKLLQLLVQQLSNSNSVM